MEACAEALRGTSGIVAVYGWDATAGTWRRYVPGLPGFVNNLTRMQKGAAYWFITSGSASLPISN